MLDEHVVEPFKACSPIKNQNLQGKIALVQRGDCNFVKKVLFAEKANASAVIVMDTSLREGYVLC
jgi:extracellular elastinolytic metalloproteinase